MHRYPVTDGQPCDHQGLRDALRACGLKVTQMSMLVVAEDRELIRQTEVGAELQLDDSTLSRNLERMRANGWLEKASGDDARVHSYRLTETGRALLDKAIPAWRSEKERCVCSATRG